MQWDNTTLFSDDNPADRAFREEVRAWIAANCPKELCDRPLRIDPPELKPWHRKLYERGWIAPHWPKSAGGMGATLTQQIILFEEMSRVGAPTPYPHGLSFIGPLIIEAGTPEQKAEHLPGILTGDVTWCQGYSEPGSGSDLASLSTSAVLDGDSFVVNGHKVWTTNGHFADWMFALVRTDREAKPRHAGITMLLIDLKSSGITVRPIQTIRGDSEFAEEFFVDVRVPKENMLGSLNGGWQVANKLLGSERFTTGHPRNARCFSTRLGGSPNIREPHAIRRSCTVLLCLRSICWRSRRFIATPRVCMPTARHPPRWRQSSRLPAANSVSRPPNCWSMRRGRSAEAPPIS